MDTATPAVTAGVVELTDGRPRVLAECVTVDAKAHGELLAPHLRDALAAAGRTFAEVDAIVCGIGPGPFTGLRAGMVTAAALGHSLDRPVFPVCSLDAIAADVPGERLLVVTDARRREVYWAAYDGTRLTEPDVSAPAAVAARVAELGVTRVAGYGAKLYDFGLPVVGPEHPSPAGLVAAADLEGTPGPLTPLYLRRPDAVEPGARKRVSAR
ncbi:TsaB protein, required for threonylcarbamoyladenosine (t(6)A) formation in tRNA [Alloactinosynnema sp. L-07]|nr:TsaB protein, required for threonylcarbamoyladenosine (t(6)A) formation in tRNA [Alloactinosynnema sp. L-07]